MYPNPALSAGTTPLPRHPASTDEPRGKADEFDEAYDVFSRGADTGALKVVLTRSD